MQEAEPTGKGAGVSGCVWLHACVCVWMLVWATVRVSLYVCGFNVPTPY